VTSFFLLIFLWGLPAPFVPPRLRRRAPPEGCLASVVSKKKRKKRLIRLQVLPYRSFFTGLIRPVSQYLWECTCRRTSVGAGRGLVACRFFQQGRTYRSNYPCEEKPVGEYLQVLAPQTFSHSGMTSAASSTWYTLAGIPVGLYLQSLPVERRLI